MKPIILIGNGGHCRSCIDVIETESKFQIAGIIGQPGGNSESIFGYEVLGDDNDLSEIIKKYPIAFITVGQIKSADLRVKLFSSLKDLGVKFPVIISPNAHISKYTEIKEGTIVMHGAIINAGSNIGENCIINNQALIEHDAVIGNHSHISTGAIINGDVKIGSSAFIGSGVIILL